MMQGPSRIESQRLCADALRSAPFLAGLFLAIASLAPPAHAQNVGVITVRVTNSQGQPQAVRVQVLADGDIPAGDAYTDSNGYYAISGLPGGTFAVVVEAEGYKTFRQTTRLDNIVQPRGQVMVVLEPVPKEAAKAEPTVAGSNSNHEVSAKHPLPPFNPKAVREFDKGNKEQKNGNSQAALERYQKALQIDANFYPALNNLGTILEQQGKHARAKQAFSKAAGINPDDGEAYINLGHVLYEEGQFRGAIDQLNQGLERSPQSAVGNFFLGSAYFKLHETEKAEPLPWQSQNQTGKRQRHCVCPVDFL